MLTLDQLIAQRERDLAAAIAHRNSCQEKLVELRSQATEGQDIPSETVTAAISARDDADTKLRSIEADLAKLREEQAEDERVAALSAQLTPTGVTRKPAYDEVVRVGAEERTYHPGNDPKGVRFLNDLISRDVRKNGQAAARLDRHMDEERVERGDGLAALEERAAGTANFSGLVVPQYLTDLVAPYAKAGRKLADAMRPHDLPETGMTVNISRITTATTTAIQANQADTVSETDIDDTLLQIPIQTNAGSATINYQAIMRGVGVDDTVMQDLAGSYGTTLDSTLINQATNGLTNVANAITYTDSSATAAELYPKLLAAVSGVEGSLLNVDPNATVLVMHSRRWYWLNSQLSSTFPLISQPNVGPLNVAGANNGEGYQASVRGVLPNGSPVIVDNNIATNLGAGTNEDEIYALSLQESHLWEDPNAPFFIDTNTGPNMKKLGVDIVLYGFFAYTFARYAHAQKISGTGLTTPAFA